jgi:hypothetical protein
MAEGQIKPKLTPETVKKLEEVFAIDGTVEEACFYAEISKQTYYNWIKEFPEMAERFDALRQRPFLKARQTIVKALDDPNHAFKYLERKKKKEFGVNMDITTDGEKVIPLLSGINAISTNDGDKEAVATKEEN